MVSVLENRPADAEIVVVHSQRYDDPYQLRSEVQFVQCAAQSELELMNTGFHRAQGEIVHLVRCGLLATPDWTDAAAAMFASPSVATVVPEVAESDGVTTGWRLSRHGKRLPGTKTHCFAPTLDAGFYRRQVVLDLDGFDLDMPTAPELGLGLACKQLGFECRVATDSRLDRNPQYAAAVEQKTLTSERQLAYELELLYQRGLTMPATLASRVVHALSFSGDLLRGRWATLRGRCSGWRNHDRDVFADRIEAIALKQEEREQILAFPEADDLRDHEDHHWYESDSRRRRVA